MPKKNTIDFRSNGPTLARCRLCQKEFQDWNVSAEDWALVPKAQQRFMLCKEDYLRLVAESGHDTSRIRITHDTWERLLAFWAKDKDVPAHHTKILCSCYDPVDGVHRQETLWCEVLEDKGGGDYVVRLWNTAGWTPCWKRGDLWLAKWLGEQYHRPSGRRLLLPVCPLMSPNPFEEAVTVPEKKREARKQAAAPRITPPHAVEKPAAAPEEKRGARKPATAPEKKRTPRKPSTVPAK